MTDRELQEVVTMFEEALIKDKMPMFKNAHRVEQVLRILKQEQQRWRSTMSALDRG